MAANKHIPELYDQLVAEYRVGLAAPPARSSAQPTVTAPFPLPTEEEVFASTAGRFKLGNWDKHFRDGQKYPHREWFENQKQALTRGDVFRAFRISDELGLLATLKWGFPGGAQRLNPKPFNRVIWSLAEFAAKLTRARATSDANAATLLGSLDEPGIGPATTSKIAYFAGLTTAEGACLIYDQMVRRAIRRLADPEFDELKPLLGASEVGFDAKRQRATYGTYIIAVCGLAKRCGVTPAQIELHLFKLGRAYKDDAD